jgi:hypothetical protein
MFFTNVWYENRLGTRRPNFRLEIQQTRWNLLQPNMFGRHWKSDCLTFFIFPIAVFDFAKLPRQTMPLRNIFQWIRLKHEDGKMELRNETDEMSLFKMMNPCFLWNFGPINVCSTCQICFHNQLRWSCFATFRHSYNPIHHWACTWKTETHSNSWIELGMFAYFFVGTNLMHGLNFENQRTCFAHTWHFSLTWTDVFDSNKHTTKHPAVNNRFAKFVWIIWPKGLGGTHSCGRKN